MFILGLIPHLVVLEYLRLEYWVRLPFRTQMASFLPGIIMTCDVPVMLLNNELCRCFLRIYPIALFLFIE